MSKPLSIFTAILMLMGANFVFAEEVAAPFSCPEYRSAVEMDMDGLEKLKKRAADERPPEGFSYTKSQFVVLLGLNLATAKTVLSTNKGRLPRTSEGKVDLTGVVMNGFNLSGLNFDNVDLKGAELNGANLSGSSFRQANLYKAELEGSNLNRANLYWANLGKVKLTNASLCQASLVSADLEGAILSGAYFRGAQLDMARNLPKVFFQNAQGILNLGLTVPLE
jgi:uncharacterized protein YjbI with pentapeptide repeats